MKHLRPRCEVCGGAQGYSEGRGEYLCINEYCPSWAREREARNAVESLAVALRWTAGLTIIAVKILIIYAAFHYLFGGP